MTVIDLLLAIVVIGVICWAVRRFIPLDEPFRVAVLVVCVALVFFLVLKAFGMLTFLDTPVPSVR